MKRFIRICAMMMAILLLASTFAACAENEELTPYEITLPDKDGQPAESDLYVPKIEGLRKDFVLGADVSMTIAQEDSGVVYYDFEGNEQELFITLAEAGINSIRVRVWNDPYDENGKGYGGGNSDLEKAIELGKRAKRAGMSLVVDFHYSDFWADPAKQMAPKAWADMSSEEVTEAVYTYTVESLKKFKDAGIDVAAVQIGNETMGGMAGISNSWSRVCKMFNAGSKAVREVLPEAKVILHFTNPNNGGLPEKSDSLNANGVDYDIFATSYYPSFHGTIDNLLGQLEYIIDTYGKQVMIAEFAWGYTMEDGDGYANTFSGSSDMGYSVSPQGQANALSDIIAAMATLGDDAYGVYYWEPAWTPVSNVSGLEGSAFDTAYAENAAKWKEFGSGWASSYASKYDPNDAGKYYGGNAWDNQALFDFDGHPLETLKTFTYVYTGTTAEPVVQSVPDFTIEVQKGSEFTAPETVSAILTDMSKKDVFVTWNEEQLAKVSTDAVSDFTVKGTTEDGYEVTMTIQVKTLNFVVNPSFEDGIAAWTIETNSETNAVDGETPLTGSKCYHYWNKSEAEVNVWQEMTIEADGTYRLSANLQGGEDGKCIEAYVYITVDGTTYKQSFSNPMVGWKLWEKCVLPGVELKAGQTVQFGIYIKYAAEGWGTVDDFELCME